MVSRIVKRIDSDYGDIWFGFGIVIKGDRAFIINSSLISHKILQQASSQYGSVKAEIVVN